MKTQPIQFSRQWLAALLLAGSILAATIGLANWQSGSVKADSPEYQKGLPSQFHFKSIKGGRGGLGGEV